MINYLFQGPILAFFWSDLRKQRNTWVYLLALLKFKPGIFWLWVRSTCLGQHSWSQHYSFHSEYDSNVYPLVSNVDNITMMEENRRQYCSLPVQPLPIVHVFHLVIYYLVCATSNRDQPNVIYRRSWSLYFRDTVKWKAIYLLVISCVKNITNLL
jgi:hypothetical protein